VRTIFKLLINSELMISIYLFEYGSRWVGGGLGLSYAGARAEHGQAEQGTAGCAGMVLGQGPD
jgi:hypothetical protein